MDWANVTLPSDSIVVLGRGNLTASNSIGARLLGTITVPSGSALVVNDHGIDEDLTDGETDPVDGMTATSGRPIGLTLH